MLYTVPSLSSLAGNYSAYYDEYNYVVGGAQNIKTYATDGTTVATETTPYNIDLTNAKACFSYITVILIGGSGAGVELYDPNGSSGACVIYQINLSQLPDNNTIQIEVGSNTTIANASWATNTTLKLQTIDNGSTVLTTMASAAGGQSGWRYTAGNISNGSVNLTSVVYDADTFGSLYKNSWISKGLVGNDANQVYTINGYRSLLGYTITTPVITNTGWPIFYGNPNCYGGTQGPYATGTIPIPYSGYARVYYML